MFDDLENVEFGKAFREAEFTFSPGMVPVNAASYGIVPRRLQEVQRRFLDEMNAQPDLWFRENVFKYWHESVEVAARFFNCDADELAFVTNATTGVNTVLKSYEFKEGDTILSTSLTYGAVKLTFRDVSAKTKVIAAYTIDIKFPIASEEDILREYEECLKAHPNTKIAIIDHITSPSSVLMPAKKIAKICHQHGALVVVDGAHAPGHIALDMKDLDVDFYTGNFHKWLYTPRGCAILFAKKKHHGWLSPLVTSWKIDQPFTSRFSHLGTRDHTPFICAKFALEFYKKIGGLERIQAYTSKLARDGQELLVKVFKTEKLDIPKSLEAPNIKLVLLPEVKGIEKMGLVDFSMNFFRKTNIQTILVTIQDRIYLRVSANIHNCFEDYEKLGKEMLEYVKEINES